MLPTVLTDPSPPINPYPGMPEMTLPSPPPFSAGPVAGWFFTLYAGAFLVIVALIWALYVGFKKKNWLPIILIGGGFLCSLCEPMLDFLGHLRWANDLPVYVFHNFGIDIPLLIPFCYAAFLGLEPYFWYLVFKRGVTVKQTFLVFAVAGLTDAIMETPGLNLHVYEYYGVQPFTLLKFPYWWAFLNGLSFVLIGALIWYLEPRLKGWSRAWFLIVPPCGMMMAYFPAGWPHILALNSELPEPLKWVATAITCALTLVVVRIIAYFVAVDEPTVNWTVGKLVMFRFMLPHQRERMLAKDAPTPSGAADDAVPEKEPEPSPATTSATSVRPTSRPAFET